MNGHVFYANDTANVAWVKYKANKTRFASELPRPTLFYGRSSNKEGKIKYFGKVEELFKPKILEEIYGFKCHVVNNHYNKPSIIPLKGDQL